MRLHFYLPFLHMKILKTISNKCMLMNTPKYELLDKNFSEVISQKT